MLVWSSLLVETGWKLSDLYLAPIWIINKENFVVVYFPVLEKAKFPVFLPLVICSVDFIWKLINNAWKFLCMAWAAFVYVFSHAVWTRGKHTLLWFTSETECSLWVYGSCVFISSLNLFVGKMMWKTGGSHNCDVLTEPMAKMRYSEMPRDVSCDSLAALRITEVSFRYLWYLLTVLNSVCTFQGILGGEV